MYASLPLLEILVYFATWIFGVFYSLYNLYIATSMYVIPDNSTVLKPGWSFLGSRKDYSDFEWPVWTNFLIFKTPWLISHFVGAELVRRNNIELLPVWYILISIIFLLNFVGLTTTLALLGVVALMYACLLVGSRLLLWAVALCLLFLHSQDIGLEALSLDHTSEYLMMVAFAWILLRTLSFGMDRLGNPQPSADTAGIVVYFSYCLYLPVLFLGPLMIFQTFHEGVRRPYKPWTVQRVAVSALSLLRYIFWALAVEAILHIVHFNVLQTRPMLLNEMWNWALFGYGYMMGQYFMMKYTVVYGLASAIARLEQMEAPYHPCCIARIHLYSHMWKYFDRGLYKFMVRYIYVPCLGGRRSIWRKLFASMMCFVFVYVWHATYLAVLIWTVLNFLGVTLEGIASVIGSQQCYQKIEKAWLSPQGARRFYAVISVPLFIMSALSNFYFLGSYTIGNYFVYRVLGDHLKNTAVLMLFFYCGSQVSMEVYNWEKRRAQAKEKNFSNTEVGVPTPLGT